MGYITNKILLWGPGEYYNQGPCPDGYHVPTSVELSYIWSMLQTYTGSSSYSNLLSIYKMPLAGMWEDWGGTYGMGSAANYYTCSTNGANAIRFFYNSSGVSPTATINREYAFPIRAFKNEPVEPNGSGWTRLAVGDVTTHGEGIWWNPDLGLITIVEYSSGTHYYTTIADKNVGATTVYSSGATLSQANCGNYFQWGNNYGFPFSGSITTSSTKVDASSYGPTNSYESSTFITGGGDWSTVQNDNLWGKDNAGTAMSKEYQIWPSAPHINFIQYDFPSGTYPSRTLRQGSFAQGGLGNGWITAGAGNTNCTIYTPIDWKTFKIQHRSYALKATRGGGYACIIASDTSETAQTRFHFATSTYNNSDRASIIINGTTVSSGLTFDANTYYIDEIEYDGTNYTVSLYTDNNGEPGTKLYTATASGANNNKYMLLYHEHGTGSGAFSQTNWIKVRYT